MIILDVNKLSLNFGYGPLFDGLSFSLNEGESISIVGPNGCGKSSLLKIIAGKYKQDQGLVNIKKGAKVAYLDQTSSDRVDDRIVRDVIKDEFTELNEMSERLKQLEAIMANPKTQEDYNRALNSYCKLVEVFSSMGGYDIDVTINTVCNGLKISETMLNQIYTTLSGGEKTLIQLAKALIKKPELILLDEPTNHLDIERIEWLEGYIKSFKGASVIVSHDRYFLDKMSNKILDLSEITPKVYCTNYTGFLQEKEREVEKLLTDYKNQQRVIKRLQEQIKYFSDLGLAKNSSTLCDRAKALQTRLDKILENKIVIPKEKKELKVEFDGDKKSGKIVFQTKNLVVKTPDGRKILDNINFVITAKQRVALIGNNGSGKSSFIKTLMGKQDLEFSGEIIVGPSANIGYLPQIINFKNEHMSLLEYFKNEIGKNEQIARQILAGFNFYKEDVNKLVKNLSGGERIRLRLAVLLQQNVNCLVFDEPTNHIDIPTKEVLEKAIENFEGAFLFVSHDRYFINKFAERTVEFLNGNITIFEGNYDYYKCKKDEKVELDKLKSKR